ncbi:MAG: tetratricopeptide repeat protein, partial [Gemmatimonadaceae bacterium]
RPILQDLMRLLRWVEDGLAGALVTGGAALMVMVFVGGGLDLGLFEMATIVSVAAFFGALVQGLTVRSTGAVVLAAVQPSGDSTRYSHTFSHIEALEIRGDLDGAEHAWAVECAANPRVPLVWIKAGDFHLRLRKDAGRALEYYRHVRDLQGTSTESARYVSQKIIDILLGQGSDPAFADRGKAMGELRRLIERFPGTREADAAREALSKLKAE